MSVDESDRAPSPPTRQVRRQPADGVRAGHEPARAALGRLGRRSLTGRLVTGVVALVIVLVGAIGAATYFALRSFLYDRLDQQVAVAAARRTRVASAAASVRGAAGRSAAARAGYGRADTARNGSPLIRTGRAVAIRSPRTRPLIRS